MQGGQDHPTTIHCPNADLRDEGEFLGLTVDELRMELQKQKKLLKKVKDEAESELAALRSREEAALREKEAALSEKEATLKEKNAVEEEREQFRAVMSQLKEEGDALRKELRLPGGAGERLRKSK